MSLEEQVGRIGAALERIATVLERAQAAEFPGTATAPAPAKTEAVKKPKAKKDSAPAAEMPAPTVTAPAPAPVEPPLAGGQPGISAPAPSPFDDVPATPTEKAMTPEELRTLAQNLASQMGDKIVPFTDFVRDEVCPRMGCQRLIEVLPTMCHEAAEMLKQWAKEKAGINVK